jgi:hypothetical protein
MILRFTLPGSHRRPGGRVAAALIALAVLLVAAGCAAPDGDAGEPAPTQEPWLVDVTGDWGLDFVHDTGATGKLLMPEIMTSGLALFDADGDGDLDLYFTNGSYALSGGTEPVDPLRNRLFLLDADGRYADATEGSGLGHTGYSNGVAVGDLDNDGDADLFLTQYGPVRLFLNRGDGRFDDATEAAGIEIDGWSSSAAFFDYDRDGFLDLYVARYLRYDEDKDCTDAAGRSSYCSPQVFPPEHDVLLHNEGDGTFRDVSDEAGIRSAIGAGLGVVAQDMDDDGWPDVYVTNDGHANQFWINQADGTFRDEATLRGAAYSLDGEAEAGMGVVAADLDNDGDVDLFMTHLDNETNTLYRNRGDGRSFEDATGPSGLASESLVFTGFGTAAFDVELDGDLDLVVVNGRVTHGQAREDSAVPPPWDHFAEPNQLYLNRGDGSFDRADEAAGPFSYPAEISRGLTTGDIDGDGDVDIVISNAQSSARIYRNDAPREGSWLSVRAIDPRYRRDAIGARVTVVAGGTERVGHVGRGSSYQSSSDPRVHFGLGPVESVERIVVHWPDDLVETFAVEGADREVTLVRGEGQAQ